MSAYTDYFKAVKGCSDGAQKAFARLWGVIDLTKPDDAKSILLDMLPPIVEKYGDAAATAAAEMYEAVLLAERGKRKTVEVAETDTTGIVRSVKYAAGFIYGGSPLEAESILSKALDYYVKAPARETIEQNTYRDKKLGARYARVPQGATTCEFCVMLASRGFVYKTKQTADTLEGKGGYHTDCDCLPVVSFSANPVVEGYDQKYYEELYKQMKDKDKWNRARREKEQEEK